MSLCLAISLGACAGSKPAAPVIDATAPTDIRVTLPAAPVGLAECAARKFPAIPDRDLTTRDVVGIIGSAKVLDRQKSRCGMRAVDWINAVRRDFAK